MANLKGESTQQRIQLTHMGRACLLAARLSVPGTAARTPEEVTLAGQPDASLAETDAGTATSTTAT